MLYNQPQVYFTITENRNSAELTGELNGDWPYRTSTQSSRREPEQG